MRRVLFGLAVVTLSGCLWGDMWGDRFFPSAEGVLTLAPNADVGSFTAIEIHWDAIGDEAHRIEVIELPFEFPRNYYVGGGCCGDETNASTFHLAAWFSYGTVDSPTSAPTAGAPHAERVVAADCPECPHVDLVLAP